MLRPDEIELIIHHLRHRLVPKTGLFTPAIIEDVINAIELSGYKLVKDNADDVCKEILSKITWKSAHKDNMEYSALITYNQMDEIRAALDT